MAQETTTNVDLKIPFVNSKYAALAFDVLDVDEELKGSGVQKAIKVEGDNLHVNFYGKDLKKLRVSVNAFMRNVALIVTTLRQFEKT